MSGAVKSLKKSFKSIVKSPLKLGMAALGTAALVFTAGSAMGALPSWGDAVSSTLGTDSTLSRVLSGAVTSAGYGALIGGAGAAVTGGDIGSGLTIGGTTGALTGGLGGAMAPDPSPSAGTTVIPPSQTTTTTTATPSVSPQFIGPLNSSAMVATGAAPALNSVPAAAPALPAAGGKGILSSFTGDRDTLLGNVLAGVGQGVTAGLGADDAAKAQMERDEAERDWISGNYGGGGGGSGKGLLNRGDAASLPSGQGNPLPADRFDPTTYGGQWVYDPNRESLVFVRNQARGA